MIAKALQVGEARRKLLMAGQSPASIHILVPPSPFTLSLPCLTW